MYRNIYIDTNDNYRWFYYSWEKFETRQKAVKYASELMDFRTRYRKTIKLSKGTIMISDQGRIYVDKSLFQ